MKLFGIIAMNLYKTKGLSQFFIIFLTTTAVTPMVQVFQKYLVPSSFDNWVIFLILLILDVFSGVYKHSGLWEIGRPNTLDKDEFFMRLFKKVFIGTIWLIMINVIIKTEGNAIHFDTFGITAIISWLGWSIASNLYITSNAKFPPEWIMDKLKPKKDDEDDTCDLSKKG